MAEAITFDDVLVGRTYEVKVGRAYRPVHVDDRVPNQGLVCRNLDSGRELFIKPAQVPKQFRRLIENLSEWRLHNGD